MQHSKLPLSAWCSVWEASELSLSSWAIQIGSSGCFRLQRSSRWRKLRSQSCAAWSSSSCRRPPSPRSHRNIQAWGSSFASSRPCTTRVSILRRRRWLPWRCYYEGRITSASSALNGRIRYLVLRITPCTSKASISSTPLSRSSKVRPERLHKKVKQINISILF